MTTDRRKSRLPHLLTMMALAATAVVTACSESKAIATPTNAPTETPKVLSPRDAILATAGWEFVRGTPAPTRTPKPLPPAVARTPGFRSLPIATTPTTSANIARLPVHWIDVPSPIDLNAAPEPVDPYAHYFKKAGEVQGHPYDPTDWAVYVGSPDEAAHQIYATHRALGLSFDWDAAGLEFNYSTERYFGVGGAPLRVEQSSKLTLSETGTFLFDQPARLPDWASSLSDKDTYYYPQGEGKGALLVLSRSAPESLTAGVRNGLYVLDAANHARYLQWLDVLQFAHPLADGKLIEGFTANVSVGSKNPPIYLIPSTDGDALVLRNVIYSAADGARVAFLMQDDSNACCDVLLFDRTTFTTKVVGHVARPSTKPTGPAFFWYRPDGAKGSTNLIQIENSLFDVTTGALRPVPSPTPRPLEGQPPTLVQRLPSPNGAYTAVAVSENIIAYATCDSLRMESNGRSMPLLGCTDGHLGDYRWMDDDHLLINQYSHSYSRTGLVDARDNSILWVQSEKMPWVGSPLVSPDGTKFLTSGPDFRVYSSAGELLQQFQPPPGISVWYKVWSPDGSKFAFETGPTNCAICGE